jgi:hypothetical protein
MLEVLLVGGKIYHDFIQIDHNALVLIVEKHDVHFPLKSGSGVHQAKRHLGIHEHPPKSRERHFLFVIWVDHDLVIPQKTIQHGHLLGPHHIL